VAAAATAAGAAVSAGAAHAAVFTVTRFDDPSPTACAPGDCSLREAIDSADAAGGTNTVLAPAGVYSLKFLVGPPPGGSQLVILGNTLTIKGVHGQAKVDAEGPRTGSRGFEIFSGGTAVFQHVSVRNGVGPQDADNVDRGGAIRVDKNGSLTMSNGSVTASTVPDTGSLGAGIYNAGHLTLNRVSVVDNQTGLAFGGGVYNIGIGVIKNSLIANNSGSFGGGLTNSGGDLTVTHSLVRDNNAGDGGAAYLNGCGATRFIYSTLEGNSASGNGGGIRNANSSVFFSHATVSANQADTNGGGAAVRNFSGGCPTELFLNDSIIAGNTASGGSSPDCLDETTGDLFSHGHNIIGDATGCGVAPTSGDQFGTSGSPIDPKLGPLANHGGPTQTMALLPGSPAIGAGNPSLCGHTDQRGFVIAHDGDSGGCDIGAYEVFAPPHLGSIPKIKGGHSVGEVLRCTTGKWAGATPIDFSFQWLRNSRKIRGAASSRHTVRTADAGHHLSCAVTASNVAGKATAHSHAVRIP
jgi:hypothetical protein